MVTSVVVGTVVAITKDELQAKIPYPRMFRGWSYQIIFENEFHWAAHSWGRKLFKQNITVVIKNWEKQIISTEQTKIKYKLEELPDGLARTITSIPSKSTEFIYA